MKWLLGGATLLIIIAAVALFVIPAKAPTTEPPTPATKDDLIRVDAPLTGTRVASPLVATGAARGTWYFEASFPIELRDAGANVIAEGYAQAQSDWMTENYVPFVSIPLVFPPQSAGSTGVLVVRKDNPSGLPEHDNSLQIPVVF